MALLAWQWRDLAAAEDALGDAFAAALRTWPVQGLPDAPEAWLIAAARRRLLHQARHTRLTLDPAVTALFEGEGDAGMPADEAVPDARLRLMFVCAHPALAENVRAPLMLQTVLGLEAQTIACAFLVSPAAMAQRLVRAKARIRETGLRFDPPEAVELPARLASVLDAIYGAYTLGRRNLSPDLPAQDLRDEAVFLARLVTTLQPDQAEAWGLLALLLHAEARREAQFDAAGRFVPLAAQDPAAWDADMALQAEQALLTAARLRHPGPFQLEAAIQSAHAQRRATGRTPWSGIAQLYELLVAHHPSLGARVGQAVAVAEAGNPAAALAQLDSLPETAVQAYAPYWVARAHVLKQASAPGWEAATQRAIGLTDDPRLRDFLTRGLQLPPFVEWEN
ncbi:MAG: RNA polymerase sigma factor [Dyella sp.]|uniref:RNA polymerase sigma factor n=1 Tax=Dyella sp. TaxID=1869338 RepID=UPI003F811308